VEGDNPDRSRDSRHFGAIPDSRIIGKVILRYRPLGRRPRNRG
ncbi:MAG: S26 family signal peptidase, partial [Actinomycetota bacterium]